MYEQPHVFRDPVGVEHQLRAAAAKDSWPTLGAEQESRVLHIEQNGAERGHESKGGGADVRHDAAAADLSHTPQIERGECRHQKEKRRIGHAGPHHDRPRQGDTRERTLRYRRRQAINQEETDRQKLQIAAEARLERVEEEHRRRQPPRDQRQPRHAVAEPPPEKGRGSEQGDGVEHDTPPLRRVEREAEDLVQQEQRRIPADVAGDAVVHGALVEPVDIPTRSARILVANEVQ